VLHRFWECFSAQLAWQWATHIVNCLVSGVDARGPWQPLTWRHGIFSTNIPRKFNPYKRIWMEARSSVLWALWIQRNDLTFNGNSWTPDRLRQHIWNALLDYGRAEWQHITKKKSKSDDIQRQRLNAFQKRRCRFGIFSCMIEGQPS